VKIIQGKLEVNIGEVKRASGVRIEVVNQHHADQLSYDMSPLSFMLQKFPGDGSYSHELKCASLTPCAPQPPSPTHAPVHAHSLTTRRVIRV